MPRAYQRSTPLIRTAHGYMIATTRATAQKASVPKGSFNCLFCQKENAVRVTIDKKAKIGNLYCGNCAVDWTSPVNNLTAEVDIYCDWMDACEKVAKEAVEKEPVRNQRRVEEEPRRSKEREKAVKRPALLERGERSLPQARIPFYHPYARPGKKRSGSGK